MPLRQAPACQQRELFDQDDPRARWERMPPERREAATSLLTRLFRDYLTSPEGPLSSEEVVDE